MSADRIEPNAHITRLQAQNLDPLSRGLLSQLDQMNIRQLYVDIYQNGQVHTQVKEVALKRIDQRIKNMDVRTLYQLSIDENLPQEVREKALKGLEGKLTKMSMSNLFDLYMDKNSSRELSNLVLDHLVSQYGSRVLVFRERFASDSSLPLYKYSLLLNAYIKKHPTEAVRNISQGTKKATLEIKETYEANDRRAIGHPTPKQERFHAITFTELRSLISAYFSAREAVIKEDASSPYLQLITNERSIHTLGDTILLSHVMTDMVADGLSYTADIRMFDWEMYSTVTNNKFVNIASSSSEEPTVKPNLINSMRFLYDAFQCLRERQHIDVAFRLMK